MKVKAGIIFNGLQTVLDFSEKSLPIKLAIKMLRLADDLDKENNFISTQRQKIIEKYGKKDENGQLIIEENGIIKFETNEKAQKAQEELNELANLEIDIVDRQITEEELENANVEITMNQLMILKEFLHKENNAGIIK